MYEFDILKIHDKFSNLYEGYRLIGSYKLYIPIYKINFIVEYLQDTKLNVIEEYICKCINMGINYFDDIGMTLALDDDILSFTLKNLKELKYVIEDRKSYSFTKEAKLLFKELLKRQPVKSEIEMYFNTLKGEFVDNQISSDEEHIYLSFDNTYKDKEAIILEPRKILYNNLKQYQEDILHTIKSINSDIIRINSVELKENKEVYYHLTLLLVYEFNNKYKMVAYDPCGLRQIDNSITTIIQELNDKGKLLEIIKEKQNIKISDFNRILENYEKEFSFEEADEEKNEIIQDIREIANKSDTLEYIMNYKIREKFIYYLNHAEESLYIISPWMNNYIINSEFIESFEKLLKRGVKVRIIYGISSKSDMKEDYRNANTYSIAQKLKVIGEPYGDLFKISHGQTHEKLLICDRKYYINGSFNFLSYSGETTGKFRNEGSTYSENKELIEKTIKLRFNE